MELGTSSKVGEVAAASMDAVRVLEDFGIDYCCGGQRSIAEACHSSGVDPQVVLQAIQGAAALPDAGRHDWRVEPLSALVEHIVSTHHEYLKSELPRLQKRLEAVYAAHRERDSATLASLPGIFFLMREELTLHMQKEERMLFPAIAVAERAIQKGFRPSFPFGSLANPIRVMLGEHDSAGSALEQIRRITRNYELPAHACETYRALLVGFQELERDLHMHIHLENNLLFPRALELQA